MAIKSVEDVSLPEVPDLDGRILGSRKQESAIWVESNLTDRILMSIVMLK
jgi:hypothetical protein